MGISRQARPTERLKKRFSDFQTRVGLTAADQPPHDTQPSASNNEGAGRSRRRRSSGKSSASSPPSTAATRYATMLAPPAPGKRPEVFKFDMSLLYTPEAGEFCIQEARAKSMALLGKKWAPIPPGPIVVEGISTSQTSSLSSSSSLSVPVSFHRDKQKVSRNRKKSFANGEPTVTINTKEALADVFGMYNSPEKTVKLEEPGTKHAPVKTVEATPVATRETVRFNSVLQTPTPGNSPQ